MTLQRTDDNGELMEKTGLDAVYWGVIAEIDTIIPDETVFNEYAGIDFCDADFFCTAE